jgi:pimeloyl-ACP methyl ester carboxylesterase
MTSTAPAPRLSLLLLVSSLAACATGAPRGPDQPPASDPAASTAAVWPTKTYYRSVDVRGHRMFYREAGDPGRPTLLLLHGYPSSSHTYRELIPLLSGRYHVVAPDNLGSGLSDHPSPAEVTYTFDLLAEQITGLVEALRLRSYVLYMQDFGAPVGYRVALAHPERLQALVVQNANAYLEGLSDVRRAFFRRAHDDRSPAGVAMLAEFVSAGSIRDRQYLRDVPGVKRERMSPDAWTYDLAFLATPEERQIQIQLFQDYQSNIDAYPAWQAFLHARQPPTLIVWGEHDPAFISPGAQAYLRDVPGAELHLIDAGHFAVEEQPVLVAQYIVRFLQRLEAGGQQPLTSVAAASTRVAAP